MIELPLDCLAVGQRGLRMLLHHRRAFLLRKGPPVRILPDGDHDHIGLGTWLAGNLKLCLEVVRHARHIVGFLRQAGKDRAASQVLTKETALKIQKKLLRLAELARVNTKEHVRVIG